MGKLIEWLYENNKFLFYAVLDARSLLTLGSSKKAVAKYLSKSAYPKLQLGCGRNYLENWLNTDYFGKPPRFVYLNAAKPFPLPDNAFERIFSEHMIEHIDQAAGMNMLRECFRVLKPSGRIRIETPDMQKICGAYESKDPATLEYVAWHSSDYGNPGYPPTVCFAINNSFRNWGHKFLYDEEMLRLTLTKAGFINIHRYSWNQTNDPSFNGVSQRASVKPNLYETFVLEAEKPK
jgi:predicted SAM-dependent methyltransferase